MEFFADLGRNTREYATVAIEAETPEEAAQQLAAALREDHSGKYPDLFADLNWRSEDVISPIELIDGLQDGDGTYAIEGYDFPEPPPTEEAQGVQFLRAVRAILWDPDTKDWRELQSCADAIEAITLALLENGGGQ